jgi:hypothetical protein
MGEKQVNLVRDEGGVGSSYNLHGLVDNSRKALEVADNLFSPFFFFSISTFICCV